VERSREGEHEKPEGKGRDARLRARKECTMRRLGIAVLMLAAVAVLTASCAKVEDKVVVRLTDNEGNIEPRTVLVGYVNGRLDRMPPHLVPSTPGDEGRLEFLEEIIRKELLVIAAMRAGLHEGERADNVRGYFRDAKAEEMLIEEKVNKPAEPTQEYLEKFYELRNTKFVLREIIVRDEALINEAYRRVTEGGEDFAAVAREMSTAASASEGGLQTSAGWLDMHPLIRIAIQDLQEGEISDVMEMGGAWYIFRVDSRKHAAKVDPLEGKILTSVTIEARNFARSILQYELFERWMADAGTTFNDEGLAVAGTRIGEKLAEVLPEPTEQLSVDERMERARIPIIPDFTDEESAIELVRYTIGGNETVWTLASLRDTLASIPGIEGIKGTEPDRIKQFIERYVKSAITAHQIDLGGYEDSQEMRDHLAQKMEEYIVEMVYSTEVVEKTEPPTGEEVKEYYRSHKEDYKKPVSVDVQQFIVGTEAQANLLHQRITDGDADFTDIVLEHSIDEWSKSKDGIINSYFQGEKRLDYLQDVAFDMEVGEISEPFRAPGGYAVIKLLATYPEEQLEFKDVGDLVKRNVETIRREARLNEFLEELKATVTIDVIDENLQYVKDPAEALEEKEAERVVYRG
jgi:parvulin-like peptidyl-prolyl isomerase